MSPSHRCLVGVTAGIAATDVWLIRHNQHTLSSVIRHSRWLRPVVVYLAVHLLFDLPHDPLGKFADKLVVGTRAKL